MFFVLHKLEALSKMYESKNVEYNDTGQLYAEYLNIFFPVRLI